jgi:hypothetical protein
VPAVEPLSIKEEDEFPAGIIEGEIYSLPHTAVFNVEIEELKMMLITSLTSNLERLSSLLLQRINHS